MADCAHHFSHWFTSLSRYYSRALRGPKQLQIIVTFTEVERCWQQNKNIKKTEDRIFPSPLVSVCKWRWVSCELFSQNFSDQAMDQSLCSHLSSSWYVCFTARNNALLTCIMWGSQLDRSCETTKQCTYKTENSQMLAERRRGQLLIAQHALCLINSARALLLSSYKPNNSSRPMGAMRRSPICQTTGSG